MSRKLTVLAALAFVVVLPPMAQATVYSTGATTVTGIESYPAFGNGDVIVFLASNALSATCPYGFWLRGTDPGANRTFASLLAAKESGTSVIVWADTSVTWSGSASAACLLQAARTN